MGTDIALLGTRVCVIDDDERVRDLGPDLEREFEPRRGGRFLRLSHGGRRGSR